MRGPPTPDKVKPDKIKLDIHFFRAYNGFYFMEEIL